jgi:predicted transcriptional regulator of viral defense system
VTTRRRLVRVCSRAEVDRALADGVVVALARGRYALPVVDDALAVAHSVTGVVSHLLSAALHHGWAVLVPPEVPHVTVPANRKSVSAGNAVVHWAELDDDDVDGSVTSPDRTLVDCLRHLPLTRRWPSPTPRRVRGTRATA